MRAAARAPADTAGGAGPHLVAPDVGTYDALFFPLASAGQFDDLLKLFDQMQERRGPLWAPCPQVFSPVHLHPPRVGRSWGALPPRLRPRGRSSRKCWPYAPLPSRFRPPHSHARLERSPLANRSAGGRNSVSNGSGLNPKARGLGPPPLPIGVRVRVRHSPLQALRLSLPSTPTPRQPPLHGRTPPFPPPRSPSFVGSSHPPPSPPRRSHPPSTLPLASPQLRSGPSLPLLPCTSLPYPLCCQEDGLAPIESHYVLALRACAERKEGNRAAAILLRMQASAGHGRCEIPRGGVCVLAAGFGWGGREGEGSRSANASLSSTWQACGMRLP